MATSIMTVTGERFLDKGVQPGMQVLVVDGIGPTGSNLYEIVSVTQEKLEVDPALAAGSYAFDVSTAFVEAAGGGPGVPLKQAV
jgi:hypothetical protein